ATLTAARPKASAPPVRTSSAINAPKLPHTRISQPMVSSCMTLSDISANPLKAFFGESSSKPLAAPHTSARIGRRKVNARSSTTAGGIRESAGGSDMIKAIVVIVSRTVSAGHAGDLTRRQSEHNIERQRSIFSSCRNPKTKRETHGRKQKTEH